MFSSIFRGALVAAGIGVASIANADPVVPGAEHCVVDVRPDDRLNMREFASPRAPIVSRKRYGDCGIRVNDACVGNWCPVEDGHSLGWVHRRYIASVSQAIWCLAPVEPGGQVPLRAWPSAQSRVLVRLARGRCEVALLPYSVNGWQKIRMRGWQGWVGRSHLESR